MSLDITLSAVRKTTVFECKVTHNLTTMATEAGLYWVMWHPESAGVAKASDAIPLLRAGVRVLREHPETMKKHNPENGWGNYDVLLGAAQKYLEACEANPDAEVSVWR